MPAAQNSSQVIVTRRTFLGGSIALGTLVLAGCAPTAPATGGQASPGTTASTVKSLRVGIPTDILLAGVQRFNPNNQPIRRTVFDYLIDKNPDGSYKPVLASKFEWSSDRKSLVLTLRDGVKYHTGRAFGPDDVLASIDTALDAKSGVQVATLLKQATGVKKTGDNQVTVTFESPAASYLDALAALPMIDSQTYASIADGKQVVGTGPFKWVSWTPGSSVELARNESYWIQGKPSFEKVTLRIITDPQATLAALRSGELDLVTEVVPREAATLKQDATYKVGTTAGYEMYVGANTAVKPLDDVRVRQAIAYALDRKRIADQVYSGFAEPSCVPWASDTAGVTQAQVNHYTYDVEKGKALIQQAGATGAEVTLTTQPNNSTYAAVQDIVQYGLEQIGLKVKTVTHPVAEYPQRMQAGEFGGIWIAQVGLTSLGPSIALLTANPLTAGKNTHNFTAPEYAPLVKAVTTAPTEKDQATATTALTDYLQQQAFHNTVVQAQTVYVNVAKLTGVKTDLTLALDLTEASLAA